jgi:hypothetical protein
MKIVQILTNENVLPEVKYCFETMFHQAQVNLAFISSLSNINTHQPLIIYGTGSLLKQANVPKYIYIKSNDEFWYAYLHKKHFSTNLFEIIVPSKFTNDLFDKTIINLFNSEGIDLDSDQKAYIYPDLIACAFYCLTRIEEKLVNERDNLGRFKANKSSYFDFLDRPIVDEYRSLLYSMLQEIYSVSLSYPSPVLRVTHDIDSFYQYFHSSNAFRSFLSLAIKHKKPIFALKKEIIAFLHDLKLIRQKPAFSKIFEYATKYSYKPYIFFITYGETHYEQQYHIEDQDVLKIIHELIKFGAKVGIHPSTITWKSIKKMQKEHREFKAAVGYFPEISRQHKLFLDIPHTFQILSELNVLEDHSMGYSEVNGFRSGTCHPYKFFNLENRNITNLYIHPLIIMENVYMNEMRINSEKAKAMCMPLIERVAFYKGELSILWHNTSFGGQYGKDWNLLYEEIIEHAQKKGIK